MKVLFLRFSSIGDIVLTTPVVRCLSEQLGAEIHYLTKSAYASILRPNPHIHRVWSFDGDLSALLPRLRAQGFDHIIDLHRNLRSARVKAALRLPSRSFHKANMAKWLMVNFKVDRLPDVHIVDRYMEAARHLGVRDDGQGLDFFITGQDKASAQIFLRENGLATRYIVMVLGAAHATKVPPMSFYHQICGGHNGRIVLLGGPAEREKGEVLAKAHPHVVSAAGRLSIGASAQMIAGADWVVTPDTGMMHIAAALGRNIISIWGSTIPRFGMTPYKKKESESKSIIIGNKSLPCRPCSKIGFGECPRKHFNCMVQIPVEEVLNELKTDKNCK